MAEEPLAIVDTNFRVYNPELDNQLNMTSAEHLKAAEKKEEWPVSHGISLVQAVFFVIPKVWQHGNLSMMPA